MQVFGFVVFYFSCKLYACFLNILLIKGDNTCNIPFFAFYLLCLRLCYVSVCYEGFKDILR